MVSGNLYLEDKNRPILIFSQKSSVVSQAQGLLNSICRTIFDL